MNLHKITYIISLLLSVIFATNAQISAGSQIIKRIYRDAESLGLANNKSEIIDISSLCPDKSVRITIQDSVISEIGIVLFSSPKENNHLTPVYNFIERYFLTLLLKKNKQEQLNLMNEDFVSLWVNERSYKDVKQSFSSVIQTITYESPYTLTRKEDHYEISWEVNNKGTVSLRFPCQYDLILGRDKKELGYYLKREMEEFTFSYSDKIVNHNFMEYIPLQHIYVDIEDTYIIPQMRSGMFMQKKGNNFSFVLNERMAEESLLNLFSHADEMKSGNRLMVTLKGYRQNEQFLYSLDRLCAFMRNKYCTPYVGLEEETETEFKGTVFYINKDLQYKHLLYFRFPREAMKKEIVTIYATLYPYIPIHNIGNLYDDYPLIQ